MRQHDCKKLINDHILTGSKICSSLFKEGQKIELCEQFWGLIYHKVYSFVSWFVNIMNSQENKNRYSHIGLTVLLPIINNWKFIALIRVIQWTLFTVLWMKISNLSDQYLIYWYTLYNIYNFECFSLDLACECTLWKINLRNIAIRSIFFFIKKCIYNELLKLS